MEILYPALDSIKPEAIVKILNKERVREHLIQHEEFDLQKVEEWTKSKLEMDSLAGCRVRGITIDNVLAGWCGIQLEDNKYEIAIVLDEQFWGVGLKVFRQVIGWAKTFGLNSLHIQLLDSRPEYKFLRKISKNVRVSEWKGHQFTDYELDLSSVDL